MTPTRSRLRPRSARRLATRTRRLRTRISRRPPLAVRELLLLLYQQPSQQIQRCQPSCQQTQDRRATRLHLLGREPPKVAPHHWGRPWRTGLYTPLPCHLALQSSFWFEDTRVEMRPSHSTVQFLLYLPCNLVGTRGSSIMFNIENFDSFSRAVRDPSLSLSEFLPA